MISESEINLINEYTKDLDMYDLGLFWQLTIKTIDDLKIVADENLTLEMYIMQITHLKNIEKPREIKVELENNDQINLNKTDSFNQTKNDNVKKEDINPSIKNQLKNINQIISSIKEPELEVKNHKDLKIKSFSDLIKFANQEKEVELKYDLERNVRLVSFKKGKIDISFNEKLNKNFIKNLTEKLLTWTGQRWVISLSKNKGDKTFYETKIQEKKNTLIKEKNNYITKDLLLAFPDAQLTGVKEEGDDA